MTAPGTMTHDDVMRRLGKAWWKLHRNALLMHDDDMEGAEERSLYRMLRMENWYLRCALRRIRALEAAGDALALHDSDVIDISGGWGHEPRAEVSDEYVAARAAWRRLRGAP